MSDFNRYKQEILTIETFYSERPDLAIHTEQTIRSAINSAASLLNSTCNNLISEVWNYNHPQHNISNEDVDTGIEAPDPNNPLYRTDFELNCIFEAFVSQTQYNINLGNEFVTGSMSGSIGNINYATARNEHQDPLAPGVLTLLAKATVYQLNAIFSTETKKLGKT